MEDTVVDTNLGIKRCTNGTPDRNATILCGEVDYSFNYEGLPTPKQLFKHIINCQSSCIIRE